MTCIDCSEKGHVSKKFYKCTFHEEVSANDGKLSFIQYIHILLMNSVLTCLKVGTSRKRKQSYNIKAEKAQAKRQPISLSVSSAVCKSCKRAGHSTARSKACPNYLMSKQEVFAANLGNNYQAFNRKIPLNTIIHVDYQDILRRKIIESSRYIRHVVIRAMLFTNYFILENIESLPGCIFQQNYWYAICQLVGGRRVTNNDVLPNNILPTWDTFRSLYSNAIHSETLPTGASQPLTAACVELATIYTNNIVENFESRLLRYLKYRLQNTFMVSDFL